MFLNDNDDDDDDKVLYILIYVILTADNISKSVCLEQRLILRLCGYM